MMNRDLLNKESKGNDNVFSYREEQNNSENHRIDFQCLKKNRYKVIYTRFNFKMDLIAGFFNFHQLDKV